MVQQGRSLVNDALSSTQVHDPDNESVSEVTLEQIDEVVDMVIADHAVVVGELESRVRRDVFAAGFTEPVAAPAAPKVERRAWDEGEVHLDDAVLQDRRERERWLRELRPDMSRPIVDPPVVTRLGVVRVTPDFTKVHGIGRAQDAAIVRAGILSAERFLDTPDSDLRHLTGLSLAEIDKAKRDIDLTALPGVRRDAANILRLAGIDSVSRLAAAEPPALARELQRLFTRHRFFDVPEVLANDEAVADLVAAAKGRA